MSKWTVGDKAEVVRQNVKTKDQIRYPAVIRRLTRTQVIAEVFPPRGVNHNRKFQINTGLEVGGDPLHRRWLEKA